MSFEIVQACSTAQVRQVQSLLREYVSTGMVDLSSQNIDAEIAGLPGDYSPPTGALFLATDIDGKAAGCVAIHRLGLLNDAEMKRLFVSPRYRRFGLGKALVSRALESAKQMGFDRLLLDTMPDMTAAIAAYESMGFQKIDPYWDNVLPVVYYGKTL